MKLVHPDMERQIEFGHNGMAELVIESPKFFSLYLQELLKQESGEEGRFVLSNEGKEIQISKKLDIVMNPLCIDINNKKILTKLYAHLAELANNEYCYQETQHVMAMLSEYFYKVEHESEYILEIKQDVDITNVFKSLGVQICTFSEDFFEILVQYIKIQVSLLGMKLLVFVNARSFLDEQQYEYILEEAIKNEISILFIENIQRDCSKVKNTYIIDIDGCEI